MGRMTENDGNALQYIKKRDRASILYLYLVRGETQKDIAIDVFQNYDDFASQTISVVTRSYGFHNGRGRGSYSYVPEEVIREFVRQYQPEYYEGGLDEGTFDEFVEGYRQQIAAQKRQAEQQRQWEAQQAAQRRAQEERARQERLRREEQERQEQLRRAEQMRQWEVQQAAQRRAQEERARQERLRREEQERQERLRQEQEHQRKEALRRAAVERGDHEKLMRQAFAALERGDYATARAQAQEAWDLRPMVGLTYIFACCCDAEGKKAEAVKQAASVAETYKNGGSEADKRQYLKLCEIIINNGGKENLFSYGRALLENGRLSSLRDSGLQHLGKTLFRHLFHFDGGLRKNHPKAGKENLALAEEVARLLVKRLDWDAHQNLILDCAYVFMLRKCYDEARELYHYYPQTCSPESPAYDAHAHLGMCYAAMGDSASALCMWQEMEAMQLRPKPLDAVMFYGYGDALLAIRDTPEIRRDMSLAEDYLNGNIQASAFYSRYYGSRWWHMVGLEPGEDAHWYCDEDDRWYFEIYTPEPASPFRDIAQGLFGKLFGK